MASTEWNSVARARSHGPGLLQALGADRRLQSGQRDLGCGRLDPLGNTPHGGQVALHLAGVGGGDDNAQTGTDLPRALEYRHGNGTGSEAHFLAGGGITTFADLLQLA